MLGASDQVWTQCYPADSVFLVNKGQRTMIKNSSACFHWRAAEVVATLATLFITPGSRCLFAASAIPHEVNRASLPLSFEPNQGQAPSTVQFISRGSGYSLSLESETSF